MNNVKNQVFVSCKICVIMAEHIRTFLEPKISFTIIHCYVTFQTMPYMVSIRYLPILLTVSFIPINVHTYILSPPLLPSSILNIEMRVTHVSTPSASTC